MIPMKFYSIFELVKFSFFTLANIIETFEVEIAQRPTKSLTKLQQWDKDAATTKYI